MASITTRSGKGSELTHNELDANFTNLNTDKLENVSEDTTPQLGGDLDVQNNVITTTGTRITIGDSTNKPIRFEGDANSQQILEITPDWTTTDSGNSEALIGTRSLIHNETVTRKTYSLTADDATSGINSELYITVPDGAGTRQVLNVSDAGVKIENAYTMPTADGSANQVLTTNGTGTLSWTTPAGGAGSGGNLEADMVLNGAMSSGNVVASDGDNIVVKVGAIQTITGVAYNGVAAGNPANNYLSNRTLLESTNGDTLVLIDGSGNFSLHEYSPDGKTRTNNSKWYSNNGWETQAAVAVSPTVPTLVYCIGATVGWGGGIQDRVTARAVDIGWNSNSWTNTPGNEFQISSVKPCSYNAIGDIEPTSLKFATCYRDDNNCNGTRYMTLGTFVDGVSNVNAQTVGTQFDLSTVALNLNVWGDFHVPIYTSNNDLWLIHVDGSTGNTQATQINYNATSYNVTGLGTTSNITNNYSWGNMLTVTRDPHATDHFIAVYTGNNDTMMSYFSISGTTITPISDLVVVSGTELSGKPLFKFDPQNPSLGILTGKNMNQNNRQQVYGIDINRSNNTFTVAGGYHLNRYDNSSPAGITYFTSPSHTNLAMISERSWSQNIDEIGLYQVGGQSSNINNVTPIGILQTGGATGTTQKVVFKGGLSTCHAGLTVGQMYGVDSNGALVNSTDPSSVHTIGRAISTTSILQRTDI